MSYVARCVSSASEIETNLSHCDISWRDMETSSMNGEVMHAIVEPLTYRDDNLANVSNLGDIVEYPL